MIPIKIIFKLSLIMLLLIPSWAFASEIVLKSGQKLEGKIIEQTDKYVKFDSGVGLAMTYYIDEIDTVDGKKLQSIIPSVSIPAPEVKPDKIATSRVNQLSNSSVTAEEYSSKGNDAYRNNNFSEAVIYFEKALKLNPQDFQTLVYMDWSCRGLAKTDVGQSINCYEKEVEINPKKAFQYFTSIGFEYGHLKQYDRSVECFKKAIEAYPNGADVDRLADIYDYLAKEYALLKNYDDEIGALEKAKEICEKGNLESRVKYFTDSIMLVHRIKELKNEPRPLKLLRLLTHVHQDQQTAKALNNVNIVLLIVAGLFVLLYVIKRNRKLTDKESTRKAHLESLPKGLKYIAQGIMVLSFLTLMNPSIFSDMFIRLIIYCPIIYVAGQLLKLKKWSWYVSLIILVFFSVCFIFYLIEFMATSKNGQFAISLSLGAVFFVLPIVLFCFSFFYLLRSEIKNLFK